MKFPRPRSLNGLILVGFGLVALPLLVAVLWALFNLDRLAEQSETLVTTGIKAGCRQALEAAVAMESALAELNEELADHLEAPLRIGIGIHAGPAILGRIGAAGGGGTAGGLTALGDTVNTASRLESASKELGAMLVVSSQVWHAAGLADDPGFVHHITVRGRDSDLKVYSLEHPSILTDRFRSIDEAAMDKLA